MTDARSPCILFCVDNAYLAQAGVALASILRTTAREPLDVYLAAFDRDRAASERVFAPILRAHPHCRLHHRDLDASIVSGLPVTERFSRSIYTRIVFDRFVDERHDRVLYLDADVVACADIRALWAADLAGRTLGAVRDHFRLDGAEIGFGPDEPYFNSGVLLIDRPAWRARACEARVLDYLARKGHGLPWMDQDALNVALRGQVRFLDLRWNFQPRCADVPAAFLDLPEERYASLRAAPGLIHYTTSLKPWNAGHRVHYSDRFFAAAAAAGLADRFRPARARGLRETSHALRTRLRWRFPRAFRALRRLVRPEAAALMYRARADA